MTAKALATESEMNFIGVSGHELLNMYVGESERTIRELFRKVRSVKPSILFIDEIETLGSNRGEGGQNVGLNTVTTLLTELDGIRGSKGVFFVAATNQPEMMDSALLRPGRIDKTIYVGLPDHEARKEILGLRKRTLDADDDFDCESLSELTKDYSGAEILEICNRAAGAALRRELTSGQYQRVGFQDFEIAQQGMAPGISKTTLRAYENWKSE